MLDNQYKDLLVQSRFRNLILWNLMAGRQASLISKECGVSAQSFGKLLNLKISPFLTNRDSVTLVYNRPATKIAAYFKLPPEYVFPFTLYALELPDTVENQYCSAELLPLLAARNAPALLGNPEEDMMRSENENIISESFRTLTPRQDRVLRLRFGLEDGIEHTLEEVGQCLQVTGERIRQIESKALRKLRPPVRAGWRGVEHEA